MLPKYTIEYSAQFGRQAQNYHYSSDDPVACEEFLAELLERGFRIKIIRHEGLELAKALPWLRAGASQRGRWLVAAQFSPQSIFRALVIPGEAAER